MKNLINSIQLIEQNISVIKKAVGIFKEQLSSFHQQFDFKYLIEKKSFDKNQKINLNNLIQIDSNIIKNDIEFKEFFVKQDENTFDESKIQNPFKNLNLIEFSSINKNSERDTSLSENGQSESRSKNLNLSIFNHPMSKKLSFKEVLVTLTNLNFDPKILPNIQLQCGPKLVTNNYYFSKSHKSGRIKQLVPSHLKQFRNVNQQILKEILPKCKHLLDIDDNMLKDLQIRLGIS